MSEHTIMLGLNVKINRSMEEDERSVKWAQSM